MTTVATTTATAAGGGGSGEYSSSSSFASSRRGTSLFQHHDDNAPPAIYAVKLVDPFNWPPPQPHELRGIPMAAWDIFWSHIKMAYLLDQRSSVYCSCPFYCVCGIMIVFILVASACYPKNPDIFDDAGWMLLGLTLALVLYCTWFCNSKFNYGTDDDLRQAIQDAESRVFRRHGLMIQCEMIPGADPDTAEPWLLFRRGIPRTSVSVGETTNDNVAHSHTSEECVESDDGAV